RRPHALEGRREGARTGSEEGTPDGLALCGRQARGQAAGAPEAHRSRERADADAEGLRRVQRRRHGTATRTDAAATTTIAITCHGAGPAAGGQSRSMTTEAVSWPRIEPSPSSSTP